MTRRIPRNYAEARRLADEARDRAFARIDRLTFVEEKHREHLASLPKRSRPEVLTPLDIAVDRRVDADPVFKAAVADNRWYIDYATMYAQGEMLDLLRQITNVLTTRLPLLEIGVRRDGDTDAFLRPDPHRTRADRA